MYINFLGLIFARILLIFIFTILYRCFPLAENKKIKITNMFDSFVFFHLPDIYFGKGCFDQLINVIHGHGKHTLFITGRFFCKSKQWKLLMAELNTAKNNYQHEIVSGEPSPQLIDKIVNDYRNKVDIVVAIGGGSVIDTGKSVSAMLTKNEPVKEYLEGVGSGKKHDGEKLPFIAVPTTAGTGSEVTKNAVLSEVGPSGFKKSLRHNRFIPDVAIIDPVLMLTCPPEVTAACAMDALSQLIESYISVKASGVTEFVAWEGIKAAKNAVLRVMQEPDDIEARRLMAYAALSSGVTLVNAGLGVVHGFASPLGGYFSIPHGVACGTLLATSCDMIIRKLQAHDDDPKTLNKMICMGQLFSGKIGKSNKYYLAALTDILDQWTSALNIPRLSVYGIKKDDIDKIVRATGQKNNPVTFSDNELTLILEKRL